jgi:hypothetical protein
VEVVAEIDIAVNDSAETGLNYKEVITCNGHRHIDGSILSYKGYRPTHDEFVKTGGPNWTYFQNKVGSGEKLIKNSYDQTPNNTELDDRVKIFMRNNKLTVCETDYIETVSTKEAGDLNYIRYVVNYSFDNYKTFGYVSMAAYLELDDNTY